MRDQIIDFLALPKQLVRDAIDWESCTHAGFYDAHDQRCQRCDDGDNCRWLNANDEFVAVEQKSLPELAIALAFAVDVVNMHIGQMGHNPTRCGCASCEWHRGASSALEAARKQV